MLKILKCYLFNIHPSCWILNIEDGKRIGYCPSCHKICVEVDKDIWKRKEDI